MAGRFLYQRLSSRMSESTRLLGARASASSSRDVAPVTRHVSEGSIGALFHGAARPGTASLGIHVYGGSIRALGYLLHGASERPCTAETITRGIHSNAPRCYNTLAPRASGVTTEAARTSRPTTDTPSVTTVKAAFADSSCRDWDVDDSWEAYKAARLAELEAKKATLSDAEYQAEKAAMIDDFEYAIAETKPLRDALEADRKAWKAKMDKDNAEFRVSFGTFLFVLLVFVSFGTYEVMYEIKHNGRGENSKVPAASNSTPGSES